MRNAITATIAAIILCLTPLVALGWDATEPQVDDPVKVLAKLERALAVDDARIRDTLADITVTSDGLADAYTEVLKLTAIDAWRIVSRTPVYPCYAQLWSTLRVTYALFADSIESYEAGDPGFRVQVNAVLYLWNEQLPLEWGATTCEPEPEQTPTPVATPVVTP